MDALKVGIETIIVGALALPWMFLIIDFFCPSKEKIVEALMPHLKDQTIATVAGVVLFAMAYMVGSSVIRISEDFFNDDDLHLRVTEDEIRADVYCQPDDGWLISTGVAPGNGVNPEMANPCPKERRNIRTDETENRVRQAFNVQESSLLLAGSDKTDRLRHLRQQIIVLRGAALNGVIVTFLCLFGACARGQAKGRRRHLLIAIIALLLAWASAATYYHLRENLHRLAGDPAFMEGTLFVLALAAYGTLRNGVRERAYRCGLMFSALMTMIAISGWWYSEIRYSETVISFYFAATHSASVLH